MNPCKAANNRKPSNNRALRATFEYIKGELKLVSLERQNMMVPPPQALFTNQISAGAWVELRDTDNIPVYKRVIDDPLMGLEVVMDNTTDTLQRIKHDDLTRVFFFILPDIPEARHLFFRTTNVPGFSTQNKTQSGSEPLVFEFDLTEIDKKGGSHGRK